MPSSHSQFGASSAARLLACPGSFKTGERVNKGSRRRTAKSSIYADEGTAAHLLAEMALASGKETTDFLGQKITLSHRPDEPFVVDADMADHVGVFVSHVRLLRQLGYAVTLEQVVEPAHIWTGDPSQTQDPDLPFDLYGTADAVAYHPGSKSLAVVDLKYGAGVFVSAEDNAQALYYAAGALRLYPDARGATITIVQPRCPDKSGETVRKWITTAEYVREWCRETLKPGIDRALLDDQPLVTGAHCRFCPAILDCPEARKKAATAAAAMFQGSPHGLDLDALIAGDAGEPDPSRLGEADIKVLDDMFGEYEILSSLVSSLRDELVGRMEGLSVRDLGALSSVKPVQTPARERWEEDVTLDQLVDSVGGSAAISLGLHNRVPPAADCGMTPKQMRRHLKRSGADPASLDKFVERIPGRLTIAAKTDPRPLFAPGDPDAVQDLI